MAYKKMQEILMFIIETVNYNESEGEKQTGK